MSRAAAPHARRCVERTRALRRGRERSGLQLLRPESLTEALDNFVVREERDALVQEAR